jgi:hypothetical protein
MIVCPFDPTFIIKIDQKSKIRFGLKLAEKSFILFLLVYLENFLCYENNSQFGVVSMDAEIVSAYSRKRKFRIRTKEIFYFQQCLSEDDF